MGLIDKLMGKSPKTSSNLAKELAAQEAGIESSQARIAAAQEARKVAVEDFDEARLKAADDEISDARRNIECRENAVAKLQVAHASALDAEAREAFHREDVTLARESAALADRLKSEYPEAAATIAQLVGEIEAFHRKRAAHAECAKALGEPVKCGHPEAFREAMPKRWSATWPNPDGNGLISGSIEEAPRGLIKWVGGEPVATRPDVELRFRGGGEAPLGLVQAIGDLPSLSAAEKPFHTCRRGDVGSLLALYAHFESERDNRY